MSNKLTDISVIVQESRCPPFISVKMNFCIGCFPSFSVATLLDTM